MPAMVIGPPIVTTPDMALRVDAETVTIAGTAQADSLVQVYHDFNNNGMIDGNDVVAAMQQLTGGATEFSIPAPLTQNADNDFVVTASFEGSESAPANVVPTITEGSAPSAPAGPSLPLTGVLFLDLNANGTQDPGERGIPGQKVFFDTNGNGLLDPDEPTAVTDATGAYAFLTVLQGTSGAVLPAAAFANTDTTPRDGNFATVTVSPIIPVFPNPNLYDMISTHANTNYVIGLYRAILGRDPVGKNADGTPEFATYTVMLPDIDVVGPAAHEAAHQKVARLIWESPEHRLLQVDSYYRQLLGRDNGAAGAARSAGHVAALLRGDGELEVVSGILATDEFRDRFDSGAAELKFLLAALLGADATNLTLTTGSTPFDLFDPLQQLQDGVKVDQVAREVVFSKESAVRQVNGMYLAFFQREAEPGGLDNWIALEQATNNPTDVAVNILGNPEFFLKTNGQA